MDESKKNQIVALVKSMVKDGTPLNSIKATLKASGLNDDEIEVIISKISPELASEVKAIPQESQAAEKPEEAAEKEEVEKPEAIESGKLNFSKNDDKLFLKSGVLKGDSSEVSILKSEVRQIKDMLIELKPMIAALKDIDEKILEANKEVLMRLKK